jgi:hypothetical protein
MIETTYCSSFRLIRLLGSELVASTCDLSIHIEVEQLVDSNDQESALKAIKLWLDQYIDSTIAYFPGTQHDTTLFEQMSNNVMMTPDEPNDYHMCILLHSKLNAIGLNHVKITKTEFASDTGEGFKCSMSGDTSDWLPPQEKWMGNNSILKEPWWKRSDASTIDIPYEQGDDVETIKKSLIVDLYSMVNDGSHSAKEQQAEIIKPAFKLKLVKDDD